MTKTLNIYAIIVTYNGMKWYDVCLNSLRQSSVPIHTIVVDNASSDDTVNFISGRFPDIELIKSEVNLGFAKANNIGIKKAIENGADYVFLLNQDAWIESGTIQILIDSFAKHSKLGIASPLHLDGSSDGFDWKFVEYMPTDFTSDLYFNRFKDFYPVNFINAAAWLISTDCIKEVGGFDTSLFVHYGEDSNYCQRVLYHGFTIGVSTKCTVCHDRGFRKDIETQYRSQVFQDNQLWRKLEMANVNTDIDLDELIRKNEVSILKARLKLLFKKVALHKKEVEFLKKVKFSRRLNEAGGLVWL